MDNPQGSLRSTFQQRIRLPLVGMVFFSVLALTMLYYKIQDVSSLTYLHNLENLTEYKLLDQRIQRDLDQVRDGNLRDTSRLYSNMVILRDLVMSTSTAAAHERQFGNQAMPPEDLFIPLEHNVISRYALARRLVQGQAAWLRIADSTENAWRARPLDASSSAILLDLYRARQGDLDSVRPELGPLLERKRELYAIWARIQNQGALQCENLSQSFKALAFAELQTRERFVQVFYLLSLVLLLSTLFFAARKGTR